MRTLPPPTFAKRLIVYGLSIAAPVVLLAAMLIFQYATDKYRTIEAELLAMARELAGDLDSFVDASVVRLVFLRDVLGPEMDLARLYGNATRVLVPRGINVIIHDASGWEIMNTAVPLGEPLPKTGAEMHIGPILDGKPYSSEFMPTGTGGAQSWLISAPILADGQPTGAISLVWPSGELARLLDRRRRPPQWNWCVTDKDGIVLTRSREPERYVGRKLSEELIRASVGESGAGWVNSMDGTRLVRGYARSQSSGWLVCASVPAAMVTAPLRETWMLFSISSLLVLALALLMGSLAARRLNASVNTLVVSAARLGRGESLPQRKFAIREFQHVYDALAAAAAERQSGESRRQLLLRELQHRTNNMLAVISSIVRRTLGESSDTAVVRQTLIGRLQALANASDTLAAAQWAGADITQVIECEMRPFAGRYKAQGPAIVLSPRAVQNTSLVIHELATNASKHGALSKPTGQVAISWRIEGAQGAEQMVFEWIERGGPAVSPPQRRGFGHTLLQTVLTDADGTPEIRYEPEGLTYRTAVNLASVLESESRAQREGGA